MIFLCGGLIPWFTAGLFIGAPLSYLHKHYFGSGHAVGPRATLPQFVTIHQETVPEYYAREEAVVSSGESLTLTVPLESGIVVVDFVKSSATLDYDQSERHQSDDSIPPSAEWPVAHQTIHPSTPLPSKHFSDPASILGSIAEIESAETAEFAEDRSTATIDADPYHPIDSLADALLEPISATNPSTSKESTEVNPIEPSPKATASRDIPIPVDACPAPVDTLSEAVAFDATLGDELSHSLPALPVSSELITSRWRIIC
jgi:hypothetical protein